MSLGPPEEDATRLGRGTWVPMPRNDKRIIQTLRDAYRIAWSQRSATDPNSGDIASTAVHRGEVGNTQENRRLLTDAQDLCRLGILKRIKEGGEPNWNALIS